MSMSHDDTVPPAAITTVTSEDALDVVAVIDAAQNIDDTIAQLQAQIDALTASAQTQNVEIQRLHAAFRTLPCPNESGVSDLMIEGSVKVENVGACVSAGICGCELGYILTTPIWAPPPSEAAPS